MAKLENSLKNMVLSLTIITIVVGALLGWVASFTADPIQKAADDAQKAAIEAVAPAFDTVAPADTVADCGNGLSAIIFAVSKDGQQVGNAVEVVTKKGFGGKVKVMVGFDLQGNITGYNVLDCSNETPGLGAKMPDWFQKDNAGDVIGMNLTNGDLMVKQDGGQVNAITAATISSRGFCDAVNLAWKAVCSNANNDGTSASVPAEAPACCQNDSVCCGNCDVNDCQAPDSLKCEKCKAASAE